MQKVKHPCLPERGLGVTWFWFGVKQSPCASLAGLVLPIYTNLASKSWQFPCLSLPSVGIIGMHHYAWFSRLVLLCLASWFL